MWLGVNKLGPNDSSAGNVFVEYFLEEWKRDSQREEGKRERKKREVNSRRVKERASR